MPFPEDCLCSRNLCSSLASFCLLWFIHTGDQFSTDSGWTLRPFTQSFFTLPYTLATDTSCLHQAIILLPKRVSSTRGKSRAAPLPQRDVVNVEETSSFHLGKGRNTERPQQSGTARAAADSFLSQHSTIWKNVTAHPKARGTQVLCNSLSELGNPRSRLWTAQKYAVFSVSGRKVLEKIGKFGANWDLEKWSAGDRRCVKIYLP